MLDLDAMALHTETRLRLPPEAEIERYLDSIPKRRPVDVLREAATGGRPIVQPRCGVGNHADMVALLQTLERSGAGVLTVTVDSHTRLKHFATAAQTLKDNPQNLNGYPLVAHGWQRGRELNEAVDPPLEVRHGSPDPRDLFAISLAAGITSFEGGGISYNLPYSKDVSLASSLEAWRQVDNVCGQLARDGVVVDRELFGTLTAVLIPPSISLAISVLEAVAAAGEGVRCVSIAYPQGGEAYQDIAALRSINRLASRYLPASVEVFGVLHEFMGVFPRSPRAADELIFYGGLVARLGGAAKVINKTNQEAHGIPDVSANAHGIRTAALACSDLLDFLKVDDDRIEEEAEWICREIHELVEPVLQGDDLGEEIEAGFRRGTLDIPFSASIHARSEIIPGRDPSGAVRYLSAERLPFSRATRQRNDARLNQTRRNLDAHLIEAVTADINYFLLKESQTTSLELQPP